jgi:hypothetical protein
MRGCASSESFRSPTDARFALPQSLPHTGTGILNDPHKHTHTRSIEMVKFGSEPRAERRTPAPNAAFSVRVRPRRLRWANVTFSVRETEGTGESVPKRVRTPNACHRVPAPLDLDPTSILSARRSDSLPFHENSLSLTRSFHCCSPLHVIQRVYRTAGINTYSHAVSYHESASLTVFKSRICFLSAQTSSKSL